jgi:replicative DNA helicase
MKTPITSVQTPYSSDMERGLLCSIMLDPTVLDLSGGINPDLFFVPAHKIIFEHAAQVISDTGSCDWALLKESFTSLLEIAEIGGFDGLNSVYGFVPSSGNWRFYLDRLHHLQQCRLAVAAAQKMTALALDPESAVPDWPALMERYAAQIRKSNLPGTEKFWCEHVADEIKYVSERNSQIKHYFELFGLRALDLAVGGVFPGELVVIGGQSSRGKTNLALQIVSHVSLGSQNLKSVMFSYEMTSEQIRKRIIASRATILLSALRYPEENFTETDMEKLERFYERTPKGRCIVIEDSYSLTVDALNSRCRRLKISGGLDVVAVDYLQLIPPSIKEANRQREVAEISRRLKIMACELNLVVVALSQLNEQGLLRESRAIGQDADYILIIQDDADETTSERQIKIEKVRQGRVPKDPIKLQFYGDHASWADEHES